MAVTTEMIKALREETGAGVMDAKRALDASDGDMAKAKAILREQGMAAAAKRAERETSNGTVEAYIHAGGRIGVLVEVNCETDFVANTDDFRQLARNIAMQIAAMNPLAVDETSIAPETIAREKEIAIEQIKAEGKPAEMAEKIAMGKVNKFFKENTLLAQAFVKDNSKSVADYLKSVDADLKVTDFKRVALG